MLNKDGISYITCGFQVDRKRRMRPTVRRWLVAHNHLLRKHVQPTYVGKNRALVNVRCIWWKKSCCDVSGASRAGVCVCSTHVVLRKSAEQRLTAGKMPWNVRQTQVRIRLFLSLPQNAHYYYPCALLSSDPKFLVTLRPHCYNYQINLFTALSVEISGFITQLALTECFFLFRTLQIPRNFLFGVLLTN